ncbi:uncharacterized protein ATNIH1004_010639 [Aspergillus tanneri]|nr:uncharacterized protein ATNIH1004_010639 [Aspergillus tanneri]KAA8643864.1 hypothetical protein ATNIH1004_010639 [Aspergillus tanneri]
MARRKASSPPSGESAPRRRRLLRGVRPRSSSEDDVVFTPAPRSVSPEWEGFPSSPASAEPDGVESPSPDVSGKSGAFIFIAPLSPSAASVVQVQTTPAPVHVDTNGLPLAQGVVPGATVAFDTLCVAPEVAAGPLAVSMVTEHRTFVGLPQSRRPAAQERAAGLVREYRRAVRKPRIPRVDSSTSVPVPERTPSHSPMAPVPATPSRLGRFVDAVLSPFKG